MSDPAAHQPLSREFLTTQWSLVLDAADGASGSAPEALAALCEGYWTPLYSHARRLGFGPEDAADLTQAFFERLISRNYLGQAKRERGRFRTFLLTAFRHFVSDEMDRVNAWKRGGRAHHVPLDPLAAEGFHRRELAIDGPADTQFDRAWAHAVLERVRMRLRTEAASNRRTALFDALLPATPEEPEPYHVLGARLGLSEGAVKLAAHRLRQRYRDVIREEVSRTVDTSEKLEAELRHLLAVMAAHGSA